MANYNLVVNSTFQPFSFDELIAPVMASTQAHEKMESAYMDLASKADLIGSGISKDIDEGTYDTYTNFYRDIENYSNALAATGLDINTRRNLLDMSSRYNKEIVPIERAVQARNAQTQQQLEGRMRDSSVHYSRDASITPLSQYIDNPQLTYSTFSGNDIIRQASSSYAPFSRQSRGVYNTNTNIPGYIQRNERFGYTDNEIDAAIEGASGANSMMSETARGIEDNILRNWEGAYDSNGDLTEKGKEVRSIVRDYMRQGASSALGTVKTDLVRDLTYNSTPSGRGASTSGTTGRRGNSEEEFSLSTYLNRAERFNSFSISPGEDLQIQGNKIPLTEKGQVFLTRRLTQNNSRELAWNSTEQAFTRTSNLLTNNENGINFTDYTPQNIIITNKNVMVQLSNDDGDIKYAELPTLETNLEQLLQNPEVDLRTRRPLSASPFTTLMAQENPSLDPFGVHSRIYPGHFYSTEDYNKWNYGVYVDEYLTDLFTEQPYSAIRPNFESPNNENTSTQERQEENTNPRSERRRYAELLRTAFLPRPIRNIYLQTNNTNYE